MRGVTGAWLVSLLVLGLVATGAQAASPNLKLERVDFKNNLPVVVDHRNNVKGENPLKINEAGENNEVEFQLSTTAGDTKNWPVMYVRQTQIKLAAQFGVDETTREFLEKGQEGNVTLIGEGTVGGTPITFTRELTPIQVKAQLKAHNTYLTTEEITANVALPNKVIYEVAKFMWKWKAKEQGQPAFERAIGTSTHNFYLTYAQPRATATVENYLTLLDLDTQGIQNEASVQPPSEAEVIKGIWNQFKTLSVGVRWYEVQPGTLHRGGFVLEYYQNEPTVGKTLKQIVEGGFPSCPAEAVKELISKGQGRCGSWAKILSFAMAIEGITSGVVNVEPKVGEWLLVKNWEFVGAGNGGEFPYKAQEIKDLGGVPGQGTQNPPAIFGRHYIDEVPLGSSKLYDPSYGNGPFEGAERWKSYQQTSIAGFCEPFTGAETNCVKATVGAEQLKTSISEKYE